MIKYLRNKNQLMGVCMQSWHVRERTGCLLLKNLTKQEVLTDTKHRISQVWGVEDKGRNVNARPLLECNWSLKAPVLSQLSLQPENKRGGAKYVRSHLLRKWQKLCDTEQEFRHFLWRQFGVLSYFPSPSLAHPKCCCSKGKSFIP